MITVRDQKELVFEITDDKKSRLRNPWPSALSILECHSLCLTCLPDDKGFQGLTMDTLGRLAFLCNDLQSNEIPRWTHMTKEKLVQAVSQSLHFLHFRSKNKKKRGTIQNDIINGR